MALDRNGTGTSTGASRDNSAEARGASNRNEGSRGGDRDRTSSSKSSASANKSTGTASSTNSTASGANKQGSTSSYSAARGSMASAPAYARSGYGDSLANQRNIAEASRPGNKASGFTSIGGASSYGMSDGSWTSRAQGFVGDAPSTNFNKTIGTDNVNSVIGNLQRKAQSGTLTTRDQQNINDASAAYGNRTASNVIGAVTGTLGSAIGSGLTSATKKDSYFSGMGDNLASGNYDSSRLTGQEGKSLGNGGIADSAVRYGAQALNMVAPGIGIVTGAMGASLTNPASGTGKILSDMAEKNDTKNVQQIRSSEHDGYSAPSRLTASNNQSNLTSSNNYEAYYDPTKWDFIAGTRGV